MKKSLLASVGNAGQGIAGLGLTAMARGAEAQTTLPQAETPFAVSDWPKQVHAPAGAPNVMLVLLDDVGFGDTPLSCRIRAMFAVSLCQTVL
jgi:hypothetical protein